jgi:hypothetical protein
MRIVFLAALLLMAGCSRDCSSLQTVEPILIVQRNVRFAGQNGAEVFRLSGAGSDTLSAEMTFVILTTHGDTLFEERFPSRSLLDYGFERDNRSDSSERAYIAERIRRFFDDTEFESPAVPLTAAPDSGFTNLSLWEELRGDFTVISFHFLVGEEDNKVIVYSRKRRCVEVLMSYD